MHSAANCEIELTVRDPYRVVVVFFRHSVRPRRHPAEISPNDPPCLLIQANELLRSAAPHHARGFWKFGLQNFSAELFHECLGRRQVRKTPAIIRFAFLQSSMPVPRLDVSSIMKVHDPTP